MTTRFHIFAGDQNQARILANSMGLHTSEWRYVHNDEGIMGLRGGTLLCFGTWKHQNNCQEVIARARIQDMQVLHVA